MTRSLFLVALLLSALSVGGWLGLGAQAAPAHAQTLTWAGQATPTGDSPSPRYDPKKKLPGAACKTADECQKHHTCEKVGDKQVCKEPPPPRLPPGAVT